MKKYFQDLKELRINKLEDLKRKDKFYSCSMLIFSLINSAIDLGNEIISAKKLEMPHSYREIFEILSNRKIITEKMKTIAHRYFTITQKKLFLSIQKLETLEKFMKKIERIVKINKN